MAPPPHDFRLGERAPQHTAPAAVVVELPAPLEDKGELMEFLAAQLELPDFFGRNWDALEECLRNLLARPDARPLVIVHRELPLRADERRAYLRLLADLRQSSLAPAARELVVYFPAAAAGHIAAALADDDDPRQADDQGGRAEQR